jgi:hypothetical protein
LPEVVAVVEPDLLVVQVDLQVQVLPQVPQVVLQLAAPEVTEMLEAAMAALVVI